MITPAAASETTFYGYRWGQAADDRDLINHASKVDGKYRLTESNIKSVIQYMFAQGWNRSSGDGVYFSDHPSAYFADGRYELFIFKISCPGGDFPIAQGSLGSTVRDYYLHGGLKPPLISKYDDNAFVIARAPTDLEYQSGLRIEFWPAEGGDAPIIWKQLRNGPLSTDESVVQVFTKFAMKLTDPEYGQKMTDGTVSFVKALTEEARKLETSAAVLAAIDSVLSKVKARGCKPLLTRTP